jgi:hypothetical protein
VVDVRTTRGGRSRTRHDAHPGPHIGAPQDPQPHLPGTRRPGTRRSAALAVATAAMCLVALSLAAAHAVYAARVARQAARAPVLVAADAAAPAKALWHGGFDTVNGRQVDVVAIEPLAAGAPLPPGVSRWPAPGEAVLSPALAEAGPAEGVDTRYGRVVGRIDRAGLSVDDERLVYLRPRDAGAAAAMHPISAYGTGGEVPFGEALTDRPRRTFLLLLAGFLGLPALVLLLVATRQPRCGPPATGEAPGRSVLRRLRGDAPAIGLGAAAALAVLLAILTMDIRLPLVGHVIAAADIAAMPALFAVAWTAGVLAVLAAATLVRPAAHLQGRRPGLPRPWLARTALLCPVLLLVAVRGPGLFASDSAARSTTYYVGVVGTLATLPAVLQLFTTRMARDHRPAVTVVAALAAAIVAITQAQLWFCAPGAPVEDARAMGSALGDSVQAIDADGAGPAELTRYLAVLPATTHPLRFIAGDGRTAHVVGSCPALTAVGLRCSPGPADMPRPVTDDRLEALLGWYAGGAERVTSATGDAAALPPDPSALVVLTADGSAMRPAELVATAYRILPLGARVQPVGAEWLTGAEHDLDVARWILLTGLAGLVLAGAAGGIHLLRRRSSSTTAGLTFIVGGVLGVVLAAWLTTPLGGPGTFPTATWSTLLIATITTGATVGAIAWASAGRSSATRHL